jgi:arylsulfatase A-like enzyme
VDRVGDGPKPFFLTAYYDGPHSPYADQSEFGVVARGKRPVDRYEAEIRLVDQQVGHLLDHLRMKPKVWDKTVVVIMADHGEEFGEHGGAFHDRTCFVESTHVPLIIRVPGLLPAVAPGRVGLVDVAPTLLALTGTRVGTKLDGQNILSADPALYAHTADARMLCTFFLDRNPAATLIQAVRDERWTYMHNFHSNESLLFDTQNDPREAHNVLQNQPAVATPLRALLANKAFKQASAKPKPVKVKRSPVPVRVTGH